MNLKLKPVSKNQLPEIAELATLIWNKHYPQIVGQQQVDYMLTKMYAYDALVEQINTGQNFYFIEGDGQNIGFISIGFNKELCETFIHKFYILTQKQNTGVGTASMHLIEQEFPQTKTFKLTVNRQNYKSINFYFKNGFIIQSVADFDIGNGYFMNDFIMVKHLL